MSSEAADLPTFLAGAREQENIHVRRKRFFDKYQWWFVVLGLVGNLFFFLGGICFLKQSLETTAIGFFIAGSCFMLVSSSADSLAEYSKNQLE